MCYEESQRNILTAGNNKLCTGEPHAVRADDNLLHEPQDEYIDVVSVQ